MSALKQKLITKITKLNPEIVGLTVDNFYTIPARLKTSPSTFSWSTCPSEGNMNPIRVASCLPMKICVTQDVFMYLKDDYYILDLSAYKGFISSVYFLPHKIWD